MKDGLTVGPTQQLIDIRGGSLWSRFVTDGVMVGANNRRPPLGSIADTVEEIASNK